MKIAVTYENGQIFQHFGHTEQFKLYEAADGKITHAEVVFAISNCLGEKWESWIWLISPSQALRASSPKGGAYCSPRSASAESRRCVGSPLGRAGKATRL